MARKKEEYTPVEGEAEQAEGWVGTQEEVAVDLEEFEPQRKVKKKADEKTLTSAEVAKEVFAGQWGVGQERRKKLAEAGYNVKEVEEEVTKLRNP